MSNYYANRGGYQGPYAEYERRIVKCLSPSKAILDVGCGRTFPEAKKWLVTGATVFGLDPVIEVESLPPGVVGVKGGAEQIDYPDELFDLIVSCAVLEHLESPKKVFNEFYRLLKPNGRAVLLTPSKYDYVSLAAKVIPNRLHGEVVNATEGRAEEDTFPTFYRANSRKQLQSLAEVTGFTMEQVQYLDQSPCALKFNPILYKMGCWYHWLIRSIKPLDFLNGWLLCELAKPMDSGNRAGAFPDPLPPQGPGPR